MIENHPLQRAAAGGIEFLQFAHNWKAAGTIKYLSHLHPHRDNR
jgi:uncharacterized protein YbcV (DUF1398 family)